jgi:hypothetical protein
MNNKTNLTAYKDLLTEMNEKPTFRFDELSQTRFDVFRVLQEHGYIKKVDRAVYTWVAKKPTLATAKRVAILTIEYRKSWDSSKKDKKDVKDTQIKIKFSNPKPKPVNKEQKRNQMAAIGTAFLLGAVLTAIIYSIITNFN